MQPNCGRCRRRSRSGTRRRRAAAPGDTEGTRRARRRRHRLQGRDRARPRGGRPAPGDRGHGRGALLGGHDARGSGRLRRGDPEGGGDRPRHPGEGRHRHGRRRPRFPRHARRRQEAPVGFRSIRLGFEVDSDAPADKLETLLRLTERYCVVFQTLNTRPELSRVAADAGGRGRGVIGRRVRSGLLQRSGRVRGGGGGTPRSATPA